MITPEARQEMEALPEGRKVHAMIVEWRQAPSLAETAGESRSERFRRARELLRDLKSPLLDELRNVEGVEVEDLSSMPQAVVRAQGERWRELVEPGGLLERHQEVRLLPNERFYASSEG